MQPEPKQPAQSRSVADQLVWWGLGCLLLAACGAGYLAAKSLTGSAVAGCGQGPGCNHVLSSRWAYWFGLPVSVPALGLYTALFTASLVGRRPVSPRMRRGVEAFVFGAGLLIVAAAVWFVLLQALVIKSWCRVCLATHFSASLAAGALLLGFGLRPKSSSRTVAPARSARFGALATLVGLGVLLAGQARVTKRFFLVTPFSGATRAAGERLVLHHGKIVLNPRELPLLGGPSATNFVVSVFDYTCSHCRALHPLLKAAEAKYPGQLAIISLPMPLDASCNPLILVTAPGNANSCEYARLGLAVWRARPERFHEFDDWMFSSERPPGLSDARQRAEELAGKEALAQALSGAWVKGQLDLDISLYQANGLLIRDGRLPQLVIGDVVIHGALDTMGELTQLLEQHLRLKSPGEAASDANLRGPAH